MLLTERLRGCPNGATRDSLRANGHSDIEINEAVLRREIRRRVQYYGNPHGFYVEWFYYNGGD